MAQNILDGVKRFCFNAIDGLRERHHELVDDHVFEERIRGIENTSLALYEAKVEDEVIISLLIKYWDLRPSEVKDFLQETKRLLSTNN